MGKFPILKALTNISKKLLQVAGSGVMLALEICLIIGILNWVFTGDAALFWLVLLVAIAYAFVVHEFADYVAFVASSIPGAEKIFGIDPNLIRKGDDVRKKYMPGNGEPMHRGDDGPKKE